MCYAFKMLKIV